MRKPLAAANWKMNGTKSEAFAWVRDMAGVSCPDTQVVLCLPFVYVDALACAFPDGRVEIGAENLADHDKGAFTGEVSAAMLADVKARFVLVGHSERRAMYGETDDVVAAKCELALAAGLKLIFCVGETLEERESGKAFEVIERELEAVIAKVGVTPFIEGAIAYEPVWAIGTGKTATPEIAQAMHAHIRGVLAAHDAQAAAQARILYGGSVKPGNAGELFAQPDIDGGLVGGASLKSQDFSAICLALESAKKFHK